MLHIAIAITKVLGQMSLQYETLWCQGNSTQTSLKQNMLSKPDSNTLHHHAIHAIRYYKGLGTNVSTVRNAFGVKQIQLRHNEVWIRHIFPICVYGREMPDA